MERSGVVLAALGSVVERESGPPRTGVGEKWGVRDWGKMWSSSSHLGLGKNVEFFASTSEVFTVRADHSYVLVKETHAV